jgi:HD-GYP domain-containing protein (c-di-GMP phosphodiesterase class II)
MLQKISVDQLRLGMHLHELCGAWLDHPFWKTKFVLRDPGDLKKLLDSGIKEVWIDDAKGLSVQPDSPTVAPKRDMPTKLQARPKEPGPALAAAAAAVAVAATGPAPATSSMQDEVRKAASVVNQSRAAVVALFNEARMGKALDASGCAKLVDEVAESVYRNPGAVVSLARLKTKDDYTYMHSVAVCALMISLGRQLSLSEDQIRDAGMAGLLHDMGKAVMPLEVLNKPGKLTDDEFTIIKSHPERGHEMLLTGQGVSPVALDVCLHHHERPDGKGYPHRLMDEQISLYAKMGSVCDVYDAITSNRPYKAGWDPAESIGKMASWRNGQFDEKVFQAFVKSLGIYPTGSLVRMKSGRLAVVVEQNETSMVNPKVKVFFSTKSEMRIPVELLDLSALSCNDMIASRESNDKWKFPNLDELWAGADTLKRMGH